MNFFTALWGTLEIPIAHRLGNYSFGTSLNWMIMFEISSFLDFLYPSRFSIFQPSSFPSAPQFQHTSINYTISWPNSSALKQFLLVLQPWLLSSIWSRCLGSSPRPWASWFSSPQSHLFDFLPHTKLGQLVIDLSTQPVPSEFLSYQFLLLPLRSFALSARGGLFSLLSLNNLFVPSNPTLPCICMNFSFLSSLQHLYSHYFRIQVVVCFWHLTNTL